jgi:hypothetical protein
MQDYKASTRKMWFSTFSLTLVCALVLGAGLSTLGGHLIQGASRAQDKVVEALYPPDTPVEVVNIKVMEKLLKLGDKFDGDEEWLHHLSLKLKNVSGKYIVFVGMYLDFPETKATGNVMAFPLSYGRNPRASVSLSEPKRLAPGEITDVAFSEQDYTKLKSFVEQRHSMGSIHKAKLRITDIYFEDGTIWNNGSLMRPDPNNPHRLIPVNTP